MSFSKTIKRELEVAFSKHSQPLGFRLAKYLVIIVLLYLLWGSKWLWIVFSGLSLMALAVHFWYRYKTDGWTKSYGKWDYEQNKPRGNDN
jgi:hypothetical protein